MQPTVLTIAGSDPTGGAGIQADLKAMTVVGVYAAAAVTCITVQNSHGVKQVVPLESDLVADQIHAVLEDHQVTHIKTGMIGTGEIAETIGTVLNEFAGEIIIDPVLLATTGQELLTAADLETMKSKLISKASVITPNLPELAAITGLDASNPENALAAADKLLDEFGNLRAVIVKGGHVEEDNDVTDFLLCRSGGSIKLVSSTRPFIVSRNTHGTGCVLASAFTAYHCMKDDDETAFFNSTSFIQQALEKSSDAQIIRNPAGRGGLLLGSIKHD